MTANETGPATLSIEQLSKRFGSVPALDGLDLELGPGELLAVVGPSGCGKSTLLRAVAGLVVPDQGRIVLDGTLVEDGSIRIPPERRRVGLVFQDHALFPHLTVSENVGFGVRQRSGRAAAARVAEMLSLVSLADHGDRYPHELSGGERQRVALARALAPKPALMLFDEPFASIDHNLRVRLRHDVVEALEATGTAALFVTHDQAEALAIGDRVAVMGRGRIVQADTPAQVFHQPVDRFVGAFMGEASFLRIESGPDGPGTAFGPVSASQGGDLTARVAMVRPDDLAFRSNEAGTAAGTNWHDGVEATIVARQYHGSGWLLTAELIGGPPVLVAASHLDPPDLGARGSVALVDGHRQVVVGHHEVVADGHHEVVADGHHEVVADGHHEVVADQEVGPPS